MCVVQSSSCKTHGNAPEQFSRRSGLTKLQGSVSTKWLLCRTVGFNPSQLLFSCTLSFHQFLQHQGKAAATVKAGLFYFTVQCQPLVLAGSQYEQFCSKKRFTLFLLPAAGREPGNFYLAENSLPSHWESPTSITPVMRIIIMII